MGLDMNLYKKDIQSVGYWRKANAIHNWFVVNCANGRDDCRSVYVSRDDLRALRDTVNKVLNASQMVRGRVVVSQKLIQGEWVPEYKDGEVIKDPTVASDLLPTKEGLLFGWTGYDEYYYGHLLETKIILENALADRDADTFEYSASW